MNQSLTWVTWFKTSVSFTYRINPFWNFRICQLMYPGSLISGSNLWRICVWRRLTLGHIRCSSGPSLSQSEPAPATSCIILLHVGKTASCAMCRAFTLTFIAYLEIFYCVFWPRKSEFADQWFSRIDIIIAIVDQVAFYEGRSISKGKYAVAHWP